MFHEARERRRWPALAVGLLAVALIGAGCGSDDGDSEEDSASTAAPEGLINEGEFVVCLDPSYPPLESLDENGEFIGFDVDVAEAVAEQWGVEVKFQDIAFAGILPALDSGRCDVAWSGLFLDPERTEAFSAVPFQETSTVIMVQGGNPADISSPEDLAGKTVATQSGSNILKLTEKVSDENEANGLEPTEVQGYERFNEAINQLSVGRADAVTSQDIDAAAREESQPGEFEVAYSFPDPETFAVYYSPDAPEIGEKLYEAMKELEESGELEQIAEDNIMPPEGINVQQPIEATG
ncbi:MAG TPA: ABC transporter substrate-binding protein [Rubrobacter sp.]|nr:ABC transporter substrate-binding protein [Rubrobacter sp.]